jgi:hypothetical protein
MAKVDNHKRPGAAAYDLVDFTSNVARRSARSLDPVPTQIDLHDVDLYR